MIQRKRLNVTSYVNFMSSLLMKYFKKFPPNLRVTTTHCNITLVYLQLDAQNSYLFTYNTFIKILYTFPALPCSSSEGLRRNCIYAASGIVTLCR